MNTMNFEKETKEEVKRILENAYTLKQRIRLFYGTVDKYWLEEYDTMGTVSRSMGEKKIPLLINNVRSFGGRPIMTDRIVMITIDKKIVYKNPDFNIGTFEITDSKMEGCVSDVQYNGENVARFKTLKQAEKWVKFMKGESNAK